MKTKLLLMLLVAAALSVSAVAGPVTVVNPGFEVDIMADGTYQADISGWSDAYYWGIWWYYGDTWASGTYNPDTTSYASGNAAEGQNVAATWNYSGYDMGLAQVLGHNLLKKADYILTVKVGNPLFNPDDGGGLFVGDYLIELADSAGTIILDATGIAPALGEWTDITIGPVTSATGGRGIGNPVEIRLLQMDFTGLGTYQHELHFDAITLIHDQASMTIDTPAMITWDGEPVDLDATAYDGITSQTWTADPSVGVVFTNFDETSEDPTVTIAVPGGGLISSAYIANAGFEDQLIGEGTFTYFGLDQSVNGWARRGNDQVGAYNPSILDFPDGLPYEGQNDGWVWSSGANAADGLKQVLQDSLVANVTYTLTVAVGMPGQNTCWPGYHVQLLAGGVIVAEDRNAIDRDAAWATATGFAEYDPPDPNGWIVSTTVFNPGTGHAQEGKLLEIRLENLALASCSWPELEYDAVQLISDVPAFTQPAAYAVTVTISGEGTGNTTAQPESIKIDVYADACQAALAAGLGEDTDFDKDCVAGLSDLAVLVKTYTDDLSLTGPVDDSP